MALENIRDLVPGVFSVDSRFVDGKNGIVIGKRAALAIDNAGKHVLVEKPMALTLEEATRMIDAADRAGVRLYVAESMSYHRYAIFGDKGLLQATQESCIAWSEDNGDQREELTYPSSDLSAFAREIEDFADYVLEGIEGPTSGRSERRSLAIVQAGYESAKSGEVVNLRERFGTLCRGETIERAIAPLSLPNGLFQCIYNPTYVFVLAGQKQA